MKAWVSILTGLPSFYSASPVRVACEDGRVLDDGHGGQTLVSDALAAPGVPIRYTVGSQEVTLTRSDAGHCIVSASSGVSVPVTWVGDDSVSVDLGVQVRFARRWSVEAPRDTGSLSLRTNGKEHSAALDRMLKNRDLLIAVHSPSACAVKDCDIPSVRLIAAKDYDHERTGRTDRASREWSISYEALPAESFVGTVPVLTWGSAAAVKPVWRAGTVESLLREIAGMK